MPTYKLGEISRKMAMKPGRTSLFFWGGAAGFFNAMDIAPGCWAATPPAKETSPHFSATRNVGSEPLGEGEPRPGALTAGFIPGP